MRQSVRIKCIAGAMIVLLIFNKYDRQQDLVFSQ